ncbi:hypothetical protein BASA50_006129 [Batrachochytrium salamandrivorans]|uniref:Uncharacterized protein n=1 Tax=Batrachochytrium salamandrivorans TaxID=1357716 RepID=A0ABQ8FAZ6_9FUNG|nr:hypothetical protein BASA50_006129 [Batrachochytrium salamandrivorans]
MNSLNTPSTAITTTAAAATTTTTTAVHFSRRARHESKCRKTSTTQYEHQPSSKVSPSSRIPITLRMIKARHQVDLQNNQSSAFTETSPIHGMIGSVLTGAEESICTDISHRSNTRMDATAAVVSSGGVAEFGSSSLTRVEDIIPPGVVADTECIGNNVDTIEVCTGIYHGSKTMMDSDVVLSDGVDRVYSNSTMQLDNNSLPEIVVGVECAGKSANTNGVPASTFCGNTTMTATAATKSRRATRVNSGNSTRQNGSSLPAIVVEAKCTSKKIVATGVRVRKPRGGKVRAAAAAAAVFADGIAEFGLNSSTQLGDSISPGMVVDAGCAGNTTGRITTPTSTDIVAPLLSRPTSRSLKRPRKDTTQLEKGWKASSEYQWVVDMKTQFKLDDVISDSLLWVSHENYIKQFDISRVGDAICKACKGVQPMQDTMLDTFCTAVGRNYPGHRNVEQVEGYSESVFLPLDTDSFKAPLSGLSVSPALSETGATAADILCHLDSATPQTQLVSYGTGHFCICHFGCGRLPEVSNCVAAALRHCPRRWATATSCLVVQEGRHRAFSYSSFSHQQHSPRSCSCSSAAAAPPLPASPSLLPVLISATVATPAVGSGPARLNNKRAAAEFTDSDTIIAAAPKRLCKS